MDESPDLESENACSFCGKSRSQVRLLLAGEGGAFICDECIWRLLREHVNPGAPRPAVSPSAPAGHPPTMSGESSGGRSFDRFTERARKALTLAQEEAQRFNHNYIGTEHLLLGLVREGEGVAAKVLADLGIELTKIRSSVEFIIGRGERQVMGEIGLTPRAKKVIALSIDESRRLGHEYVGTEHLLLGLMREGEGIAAGVLESLGINLERVRIGVIGALSGHDPSPQPPGRFDRLTERASKEVDRVIGGQEASAEPRGRFDRFTEHARKVLALAQEEAHRLAHNRIGPEHLLLGLALEDEGVHARVLSNLGVELTKIRSAVEFITTREGKQVEGEIGLTPPAKKVIELAVDEARRLHHHYVGTEHLLLGLLREGDSVAAGVLESLGLNLEKVRSEVMRVLDLGGGETPES
jgi:ATP-dependent Clp protease ATP-binding subunit ClpA